jgi:hypothetical protein
MSISAYFRPNIHQNGPEILGVKGNEDNMSTQQEFSSMQYKLYMEI